ncbi:MAG: zinc ribbon domain-containing protein [Pseudomonadota bacterium]
MPLYEYECTKCHRIDEVFQKFSDKPLAKCTHCSGKLQKLISQSTFHLKGTGWYVTDYVNKSRNASPPDKTTEKATAATADKSDTAAPKPKKTVDTTP